MICRCSRRPFKKRAGTPQRVTRICKGWTVKKRKDRMKGPWQLQRSKVRPWQPFGGRRKSREIRNLLNSTSGYTTHPTMKQCVNICFMATLLGTLCWHCAPDKMASEVSLLIFPLFFFTSLRSFTLNELLPHSFGFLQISPLVFKLFTASFPPLILYAHKSSPLIHSLCFFNVCIKDQSLL